LRLVEWIAANESIGTARPPNPGHVFGVFQNVVSVGMVVAVAAAAGTYDLTQQDLQNGEIPGVEKDYCILLHVLGRAIRCRSMAIIHLQCM